MASRSQQRGGGREGGGRKGHIPDDLQLQARKAESPVVSELLVSARKGYTAEVLRLLQEKEGRATSTDKHGRTCLHLACVHGHFDTVLAIVQSGLVDVNAVNKRGLTPLHETSVEGHTRIALLLLSMGAVVSARTKEGWTPLMFACSNGHAQLAQLLIAAGNDINACTKAGLTSLHIAAWKGRANIVEMLVRVGCSPLAHTTNGKTPLVMAHEEEQYECATILQAAMSKQSEDPVYRISALEGQVRLCQDKLIAAHRSHEETLTTERVKSEDKLSALRESHRSEMEQAQQKINELEEKLSEVEKSLEKALKSQVEMSVESSTLTSSPARRRKHKKDKEQRKRENGEEKAGNVFSPTRTISPDILQRSASANDLEELERGRDGLKARAVNRSTDANTASQLPRTVPDKLTITDLVAESLKKPGSMASIRRELKADALTPRIQKKFPPKTTPTSLPAVQGGAVSETSPLTKNTMKVSPNLSPRTLHNSSDN